MDAATHDLNIPLGAPNWMDLVVRDVDAGTAFYSELFGWTVNDSPPQFGGYKYFTKDGKAVGGCMRNDADFNMPNVWQIFLHTDNSDRTAELAKEHGGEVFMPTMKVEDNGSFCIVADPSGAVLSAWEPNKERGFGVMYEAGTPAHFELMTHDYAKAVEFYKNVFGWSPTVASDTDDFRYTVFGTPESPRAGIMDASKFLPADVPSHWSVYIACNDTNETAAKAESLGATIVAAPEQTPYGTLATLSDNQGAVFKLQS